MRLDMPSLYWVYIFATITLLTVALRRLKSKQDPLNNENYSRAVAFEHVHSGIAWVKKDGLIGSANASMAGALSMTQKEMTGMSWYELFATEDKAKIEAAYSQMLLIGKAQLDVHGRKSLGDAAGLELLLVAVHDHKMRFVGHHCLVADRSRERQLETQVRELRANLDKLALALATVNQAANANATLTPAGAGQQ